MLVAAFVVVVVAAVAIGVALARQHNNNGPTAFTPGTPTLNNQKLESDMQELEKSVRR
jgi:hypothetical protein